MKRVVADACSSLFFLISKKINKFSKRFSTTSENKSFDIRSTENLRSDDNIDSAKFLTVFPYGIWLQILETIFDPKDLHHLQQSSQFFRSLFQDIKTKTLFPEVAKVLAANLNSAPNDKWNILLKCQSVCRTWTLGVDSVLQSFFEYRKLLDKPEHRNQHHPKMASTDIQLEHDHRAKKFLPHFNAKYAASKRNPFLCKSVRMDYEFCCRDIELLTPQVLKTFRIYGHNISRFCLAYDIPFLTLHSKPRSLAGIFEQLPKFLKRMPYLKVLELCCYMDYHISKVDLEDLELNMQTCAFPALTSLQHISVKNFPTPAFDAVLRNYSYVPMLSLCNDSVTSSHLSLYAQPMPNLTQLELGVEKNYTLMLLEISNIKWQLTTLLLNINTAVFDWKRLFRILETRWADTLTELKIEADYFWRRPPYTLPSLKLPNLKVFILHSKNVVPLDFILPIANTLERLVVLYKAVSPLESELKNEQVVKFYMFRKNLMNSNIWTMFPILKFAEYYDTKVGLFASPNRPIFRREKISRNCSEDAEVV